MPCKHILCNWSKKRRRKVSEGKRGKGFLKNNTQFLRSSEMVCLRHYGAFSKLSTFRTKDSCDPSSGGCCIYSLCTRKPRQPLALSAAPACLKKTTSLPGDIDSSAVNSPSIRGRPDCVFLLSRWIPLHLEDSKSQSGITFLTIIYELCTTCVWIEKGFHISSINSD